MTEKDPLFEPLMQRTEEYIKTTVELYQMKAIDKASEIASNLASKLIVLIFLMAFMLFLNFGIAYLLGTWWDSIALGFLVLAAFYAICALLIMFVFGRTIKVRLRNAIISQFLN